MTFRPVFYLLTLLIILLPLTAPAQETEYTVTGKVTTSSGEPLAGVNVYISNTLEGASTDPSGFFEFTTSLRGKFQLVASFIGFQSSEQVIYLLDDPAIEVNFELEESVFDLDELVVQGEFDKEWNRYLREFETFFIGSDDFARQTTLLNPEVLEFEWLESQKKLRVINKAPLRIRNDALGYFIELELQNVVFDPATNTGYYIVKSRYEEMETESRSTRREWRRNRQTAYKGSSRHFFHSLNTDRLRRNKFEILPSSSAIQRIEDDALLRRYYPNNWQFMKENYTSFYITTPQLSIGHDLDKDRGGRIQNPGDLSRLYTLDRTNVFSIDFLGLLYKPENVQYQGKWSRDRFSKSLPINYPIR